MYRSHPIVHGWCQVPDCGGTFVPAFGLQSIRMMLVIAAELGYEVFMLDISNGISERRLGGRRLVQDGPRLRNCRQVRRISGHEISRRVCTVSGRARRDDLARWTIYPPKSGAVLSRQTRSFTNSKVTLASLFLRCTWTTLFLLSRNERVLNKLKKQVTDRFEMTDTGDVSRVLGMNITRNREKATIPIDQKYYTEDVVERFCMKDCNPAFTSGAGPKLSLNQPENILLGEESKRQNQSIVGAAMYLEQVSTP